MTDREKLIRLYDALKQIGAYTPPAQLKKHAMRIYGLDPDDAIEMAYENVLLEAKEAIRGMRRPGEPPQTTPRKGKSSRAMMDSTMIRPNEEDL